MIDSNVSLDLMTFIEQNILPKYNEFGASHGLALSSKSSKTVWNWLVR